MSKKPSNQRYSNPFPNQRYNLALKSQGFKLSLHLMDTGINNHITDEVVVACEPKETTAIKISEEEPFKGVYELPDDHIGVIVSHEGVETFFVDGNKIFAYDTGVIHVVFHEDDCSRGTIVAVFPAGATAMLISNNDLPQGAMWHRSFRFAPKNTATP